ncbi:MAG TPA: GNAT family N-acetyltransferase [Candidatus Limnocylindrales bacterium]|nr:GNAT family N-acetyltransferase [Candidatus Limnocylindrales bacterium]
MPAPKTTNAPRGGPPKGAPDIARPETAPLDIQPLEPDGWNDLASLFEEGGDPKWCWCMYWRLRSKDFAVNRAAANRAGLRSLTDVAAAEAGSAPGLIGYRDGRAVGWVSLGPRSGYERLERSTTLRPIDDRPVWSVVCFVVSRRARNRGLARALLDGAITYARKHGAPALEAYPTPTEGAHHPAASLYRGTLGMFQAADFKVVGWSTPHANAAPRPIVRLELG